jgi:phytoene dehydrogenase-like protein
MSEVEQYDAVVVGGALGGLCAAAILVNRGWRVAVVEPVEHLGGRVGAVEHDGYWIGWGHRDGHGIGDLCYFAIHTRRAADAAGVELTLRPFMGTSVRVHWLPEGEVRQLPVDSLVASDGDPMGTAKALARFFGGEIDDVDAIARGYLEIMTKLATMDEEEAWRLVPSRIGDWLDRNAPDPAVRQVVLQQFECIPFTPAAESSTGRVALHLRNVQGEPILPDDPEVGGMQGVVVPFARRVEAGGGRLMLGWKPLEIIVDEGEVKGVVVVDQASLVRVLEAPVVITDYPGWRLPEFVDESLLPAPFLEAARRTEAYGADAACWWAGLRRLPTVSADGQPEDFSSGWHRVLYGHGSVRECHGGFYFPSGFSSRAAPPGKHLLGAEMVASGEGGRRWRHWAEAKRAIDMIVDHLHDYYADLDDCVEWSSYQYVTPPQYLSWYIKPVERHPVGVSTVRGLYVAASSSEGTGSWADAECAAALKAVELAEAERSHLRARTAVAGS